MAGEIVVMLVEKVTFLREIRLSEQFLNWNKVLLLRFLVLREVNSSFCSKTQWQMFLLVSEHGVPIQISINLGNTFLRISSIRKIVVAWILARVFAYLPSFFSLILDSIYWTVLIFHFDLLWMVWHWKPVAGALNILNLILKWNDQLSKKVFLTVDLEGTSWE